MSNSFKEIFPNLLTLSRGLFVIIITWLFYSSFSFRFPLIYLLFILAGVSDYFDGTLARKWKVKSDFGIVFDSLFDKILTFALYVLLIPYSLVHPAVFIALIFRDLVIDGIKNFSLSKGVPIPARPSGKTKMLCQTIMINFALLLLIFPGNSLFTNLLYLFAVLAVFFSYFSGTLYILDWISSSNEKSKRS